MHSALEYNFGVLLGFPEVEGRRLLKLVGIKDNFHRVLNYIGKIADGDVVTAPLTPMKGVKKNVERGKMFYCLYCSKGYLNQVLHHCFSIHHDQPLVQEIMKLEARSEKRKALIKVYNIYLKYFCYMIYIILSTITIECCRMSSLYIS